MYRESVTTALGELRKPVSWPLGENAFESWIEPAWNARPANSDSGEGLDGVFVSDATRISRVSEAIREIVIFREAERSENGKKMIVKRNESY